MYASPLAATSGGGGGGVRFAGDTRGSSSQAHDDQRKGPTLLSLLVQKHKYRRSTSANYERWEVEEEAAAAAEVQAVQQAGLGRGLQEKG